MDMSIARKVVSTFMSAVLAVSFSVVVPAGGVQKAEAATATTKLYYNVYSATHNDYAIGDIIYVAENSTTANSSFQGTDFGSSGLSANVTLVDTSTTLEQKYKNTTGKVDGGYWYPSSVPTGSFFLYVNNVVKPSTGTSSFDSDPGTFGYNASGGYYQFWCNLNGVRGDNKFWFYKVQSADVASLELSTTDTTSSALASVPTSYTVSDVTIYPKTADGNRVTKTVDSVTSDLVLNQSLLTSNATDYTLGYSTTSATSFTIDGTISATFGNVKSEKVYTDYVLAAFDKICESVYTDTFYKNYFAAQKTSISTAIATCKEKLASATTQAEITAATATLAAAVKAQPTGAQAYTASYQALSNKAAITDADIENLQTAVADYENLDTAGKNTCKTIYTNLTNQLAAAQWDQKYGDTIGATTIDITSTDKLDEELAAVNAALAAYNGTAEGDDKNNLTEAQRSYVSSQKAALDAQKAAAEFYKDNYTTLTATAVSLPADADAADELVSSLTAVQSSYNGLSSAAQTYVTNADSDIATQLQAQIDAATFMKTYVALLNKSADDYTTSDLATLEAASTAFGNLSAEAKAMLSSDVTTKLGYATAARNFMNTYASGTDGDNNIVNQATVTDADLDRTEGIEAAIAAYNALNDEQKQMVGGQTTLNTLTAKKASAKWYQEHSEIIAADATDALTDAERTAAKAACEALTDAIGAYIDEDVKTSIKDKNAAATFYDTNKDVIEGASIGYVADEGTTTVSPSSDAIQGIIDSYNNLNETQQKFADGGKSGDTSAILTNLTRQKAVAEFLETHKDVLSKIKNDLSASDREALAAAAAAYDELVKDDEGTPQLSSYISDAAKELISFSKEAEAWAITYEALIDADTVDAGNLSDINEALATLGGTSETAEDNLSEFAQKLISDDIKTKLTNEQSAAQWFTENATAISAPAAADGILTKAERTAVKAAVEAYGKLDSAEKGFVSETVYTEDTDAEKQQAASLNNAYAAATFIDDNAETINNGTVAAGNTAAMEKTIADLTAVKTAYNNLTEVQQALADGGIDGQTNTSDTLTKIDNQITVATFLKDYADVLGVEASTLTSAQQGRLQAAASAYATMVEGNAALANLVPETVKTTIGNTNAAAKFLTDYATIIGKETVTNGDLGTTAQGQTGINAAIAAYDELEDAQKALIAGSVKTGLDNKYAAATWYAENETILERATTDEAGALSALTAEERAAVQNAYATINGTEVEGKTNLTADQKVLIATSTQTDLANKKDAVDYYDSYNELVNTTEIAVASADDLAKTIASLETAVSAYGNLAADAKAYADGGTADNSTTLAKLNNQLAIANFLKDHANVLNKAAWGSSDQAALQAASADYKALFDGKTEAEITALKALIPDAVETLIADSDAVAAWTSTYNKAGDANTIGQKSSVTDEDLTTIDAALEYKNGNDALSETAKGLISQDVKDNLAAKKDSATWYKNNKEIIAAGKDDALSSAELQAAQDAYAALTANEGAIAAYIDATTKADLSNKNDAANYLDDNAALIAKTTVATGDATAIASTIAELNTAIANYKALSADAKLYADGGVMDEQGNVIGSTTFTALSNQLAAATYLQTYADLFTKTSYTTDDLATLRAAKNALDGLSADVKALLDDTVSTKIAYLTKVEAFISAYETEGASTNIVNQATVSDDDLDTINAAIAAYDDMNDFEKALIGGSTTEAALDNRLATATWYSENASIIEATGVTSESKTAIDAALEYTVGEGDQAKVLTEAQKALIDSSVTGDLADKSAAANFLYNNEAAVNNDSLTATDAASLQKTIDALDAITAAYNSLSAEQQAYVDGGKTGEGAAATSDTLAKVANQKAAAEFLKDYAAVFTKAAYTVDDVEALKAAAAAYDELSEDVKALLTSDDPDTPTAVTTRLGYLDAYNAYKNTYKDILAATTVDGDDLGTTEKGQTGINAAVAALDDANDFVKGLLDSDKALSGGLADKHAAATWYAENEAILERATAAGELSADERDEVLDAYATLYSTDAAPTGATKLTEAQQALIAADTTSSLANKKAAVDFINGNATEINATGVAYKTVAGEGGEQSIVASPSSTELQEAIDAYNALSADQQAFADGGKTAEGTSNVLANLSNKKEVATFLEKYADVFNKAADGLTTDDQATLQKASAEMKAMVEENAALAGLFPEAVTERIGLSDAAVTFAKTYADTLAAKTVTNEDLSGDAGIEAALAAYDKLDASTKKLLGSSVKTDLDDKQLVATWYADNEAIIEAEGVTSESKTAIDAALDYSVGEGDQAKTLTDEQKKLIPTVAVTDLGNKKAAADFLTDNEATVNNGSLTATDAASLQKTIDALDAITAAYNSLSAEQQAYVDGGKTGEGAAATSDTLAKVANQKAAAEFLKDYADLFTKDSFTVDDVNTLKAAAVAYDELSEEVKALLTSDDPETPTAVTERLGYLDAYNDYKDSYATILDAQTVTAVDLDSQAGIEAAITALNDANAFVKGLLDSDNAISTNLGNKKTAAEWYETNAAIIAKTGTLAESDYASVNSAVSGYDKLDAAVKALVPSSVITESGAAGADAATLNNMKAAVDYMAASKAQRDTTTIEAAADMSATIESISKQINAYNNLSASQKAYADGATTADNGTVTGSSVLAGLSKQLKVAQFLNTYEDVLGKDTKDLTADDQAKLQEASAAYKAMIDPEKGGDASLASLVSGSVKTLIAASDAVASWSSDNAGIISKSPVTDADLDAIDNAIAGLTGDEGLSDLVQQLVSDTVKGNLTNKKTAAEWYKANAEIIAAQTVTGDSLDSAGEGANGITAALNGYDQLGDAAAFIDSSVKTDLDNKNAAASWYKTNEGIIGTTGALTIDDATGAAIEAALNYTNGDASLTDAQKALITSDVKDGLADKKAAYDYMVASRTQRETETVAAGDADAMQATVKAIQDQIDAYNKLTAAQKAYADGATTDDRGNVTGSSVLDGLGDQLTVANFLKDYADVLGKDASTLTSADQDRLAAASKAYADMVDAEKGNPDLAKLLPESVKTTIVNSNAAGTWDAETKNVTDLDSVTADNLDAIDKALAAYDALDDASKELADPSIKTKLDNQKSAAEWDKAYKDLLSKDASQITADDMAAIMAATEAYNALSDDVKSNISASVKDMLQGTQSAGFTKKYLTDKGTNAIFTKVTTGNYEQIVSGADDWAKLTQEQKDAINATLLASALGKTYDDILGDAQGVKASTEGFVKKYLTGTDGKVYSKISNSNYKSIIAGQADWAKLSKTERDAVNALLKAASGKTYSQFLSNAKKSATFALNLGLKVKQKGKKLKISWGKVKGVSQYQVYVQYCGKKYTKKSIYKVKGSKAKLTIKKINKKKIKLAKNYKIKVVALAKVGGKTQTVAKSIEMHFVGKKNKKYTNPKKLKIKSKKKLTLKKGKTSKIKAKVVLVSKKKKSLTKAHAAKFRYASSDTSVAKVSKKGKIKAVGKGSCTIYVYAKNGFTQTIKVTVK